MQVKSELPLCQRMAAFQNDLNLYCDLQRTKFKNEISDTISKCFEDGQVHLFDVISKCQNLENNKKMLIQDLINIRDQKSPSQFIYFSEGGSAEKAYQSAMEHGVCLERQVRSQNFDTVLGIELQAELIQKYLKSSADIKNIIKDYHMYAMQILFEFYYQQEITDIQAQNLSQILSPIFPELEPQVILKTILTKDYETDPLTRIFNFACRGQVITKQLPKANSVVAYTSTLSKKLLDLIHSQMQSGKPIAIGFSAAALRPDLRFSHESILLAGESTPEGWSYVLRNSWGNEACEKYKDTVSGTYTCKDGNFIISEKSIAPFISEAMGL